MKWSIPAKTFFLGEYAAITGAPAIVLTTRPCFEVTLTDEPGLQGIHPDSPAGQFWTKQGYIDRGLHWHDPYGGCGGLGASSAQWLGAWFASAWLADPEQHHVPDEKCFPNDMLNAYFQSSWQGVGVRPSGYDVLAQSMSGCVYIHRQQSISHVFSWPFHDLAFILVHTGQKLATHHHLQSLNLTGELEQLTAIVASAKTAFETSDSQQVINAVNEWHQRLLHLNLLAPHSLQQIELLKACPDILAAKGCGAMGADVLLLLLPVNRLVPVRDYLAKAGLNILATSENLYKFIENT